MTLRIAFCGPNVELCEKLADHAYGLLNPSVVDIVRAPNFLREMLDMIRYEKPSENLDWMNLWTSVVRRMFLESMRETQVIVSGSCGIDQVAWQAAWLADQVSKVSAVGKLIDPSGKVVAGPQEAMINRSGAVLQTLVNHTEEEMVDYWDFVYAVMPITANVAISPNSILTQYQDFLLSVPVFQGVERLPDNELSACDVLDQEVEKWKTKLNVS